MPYRCEAQDTLSILHPFTHMVYDGFNLLYVYNESYIYRINLLEGKITDSTCFEFGYINRLDVSQPMKLLVFDQVNQHISILDNKLNLISTQTNIKSSIGHLDGYNTYPISHAGFNSFGQIFLLYDLGYYYAYTQYLENRQPKISAFKIEKNQDLEHFMSYSLGTHIYLLCARNIYRLDNNGFMEESLGIATEQIPLKIKEIHHTFFLDSTSISLKNYTVSFYTSHQNIFIVRNFPNMQTNE
jgi:hypothetical protein